jgi:hypothetical protein
VVDDLKNGFVEDGSKCKRILINYLEIFIRLSLKDMVFTQKIEKTLVLILILRNDF